MQSQGLLCQQLFFLLTFLIKYNCDICSAVSTAILIKLNQIKSKFGWSYDSLFPHNLLLDYSNCFLLILSFIFLQFILQIDLNDLCKMQCKQVPFLFQTLPWRLEPYSMQMKTLSMISKFTYDLVSLASYLSVLFLIPSASDISYFSPLNHLQLPGCTTWVYVSRPSAGTFSLTIFSRLSHPGKILLHWSFFCHFFFLYLTLFFHLK